MSDTSTALVPAEHIESLPLLVERAAERLASAKTAAEVLEAKNEAAFAYETAKAAGKFARAQGAYSDLISKVHRTQADALEIEALAKRRLADEYDAAQERGEMAKRGDYGLAHRVSSHNGTIPATTTEAGINRKDIHEARMIRDVENAEPGAVKRLLQDAVDSGREPTRAVLTTGLAKKRSLSRADRDELKARVAAGERPADIAAEYGLTGAGAAGIANNTSVISVPPGSTVEIQVRKGMELEATGMTTERAARDVGVGDVTYRRVRELVVMLDEIALNPADREAVIEALAAINETRQLAAHATVEHIVKRVWGEHQKVAQRTAKSAAKRVEHFAAVVGSAVATCEALMLKEVEIPYLTEVETTRWARELKQARKCLDRFLANLTGKGAGDAAPNDPGRSVDTSDYLAKAADLARQLGAGGNPVTIDDIHNLLPPPDGVKSQALGQIFNKREWGTVGYVNSGRRESHGRRIQQWRLLDRKD